MKQVKLLLIIVSGVVICFVIRMPAQAQTLLELTLEEVSALAFQRNLDIQIARYDAAMKRNDIYEAVSLFDTILNAALRYEDDQLQRTSTILGSQSITAEYEFGISKKLPTGTTLGVGFDNTRTWTNSAFAALNPAHDARASFSLVQEVGKNFFGLLDRTKVKITKIDIENAHFTSLEKIELQLAAVQKAYWSVIKHRQKVAINQEMLSRTEALLAIYRDKIKIGMAEKTDLYAAEAGVEIRKRDLLMSENELRAAINDVLLKLNFDIREEIKVITRDDFSLQDAEFADFISCLSVAVENRRDYKKAYNEAESRQLNVVMKKNSLWPEVDLEATLVRNGVGAHYKEAAGAISDEDNLSYFFGITVSVPLENTKARGEFNTAALDKAKALVLLKQKEREIVVEVHDAVDTTNTILEKVKGNIKIVELQSRKLKEEEKRFRLGRSNSDTLIRFQDDLLQARLNLSESLYDYYASRIDLKVAENALLNEYWEPIE